MFHVCAITVQVRIRLKLLQLQITQTRYSLLLLYCIRWQKRLNSTHWICC